MRQNSLLLILIIFITGQYSCLAREIVEESEDIFQEAQDLHKAEENSVKKINDNKSNDKKKSLHKIEKSIDISKLLKQEQELMNTVASVTQSHVNRVGKLIQRKLSKN